MSDLMELKRRVKEASDKRMRAEGLRDSALSRLEELGYDTPQEAEKALAAMKKEITEEEAAIEEELEQLQQDFPEL